MITMSIITIHKAVKKPVEIEYIQFKNMVNAGEIERWTNLKARYEDSTGKDLIYIDTLEGTMTASINGYIVKDVHGEFYPVKPDVFEKTYDILEEVSLEDYTWSNQE